MTTKIIHSSILTLSLSLSVNANAGLFSKIKHKINKILKKESCIKNSKNIKICTGNVVFVNQTDQAKVEKIYSRMQENSDFIAEAEVDLATGENIRVDVETLSLKRNSKCLSTELDEMAVIPQKEVCKRKRVLIEKSESEMVTGKVREVFQIIHSNTIDDSSIEKKARVSWDDGSSSTVDISALEVSIKVSPVTNTKVKDSIYYESLNSPAVAKVKEIFSNNHAVLKPKIGDFRNKPIINLEESSASIECVNGIKPKNKLITSGSSEMKAVKVFENGMILVKSRERMKSFDFVDSNSASILLSKTQDMSCNSVSDINGPAIEEVLEDAEQVQGEETPEDNSLIVDEEIPGDIDIIIDENEREPTDEEMN
jgi:hypothetical protein